MNMLNAISFKIPDFYIFLYKTFLYLYLHSIFEPINVLLGHTHLGSLDLSRIVHVLEQLLKKKQYLGLVSYMTTLLKGCFFVLSQ